MKIAHLIFALAVCMQFFLTACTHTRAAKSQKEDPPRITQSYDVSDLLVTPYELTPSPDTTIAEQKLIAAITENIAPDSWKTSDIKIRSGNMIVTQTPAIQTSVEILLSKIRRQMFLAIQVDARIIFPAAPLPPQQPLDTSKLNALLLMTKMESNIALPPQRPFENHLFTISNVDPTHPANTVSVTLKAIPSPDRRYMAVVGDRIKSLAKSPEGISESRISIPDGSALIIPLERSTPAYLVVRFKIIFFDETDAK